MTTKKISTVLLTGTLALSACQILPEFSKPVAPIPEKFPVTIAPEVTAAPVAEVGWRDFFLNPGLKQTIAAALANNRDLKTAVLRIDEARALYNIQRSDQKPTVNATANASDSRQLLAGTMRDTTTYQVGLGMTAFELDFFGRVKNLSESALAQFFATEEAQRAMQVALVGEVAKAWLSERGLTEQIALAERTLKARTTSYDLVKKRFDAGVTNALELRQSETLVQTARAALISLKRQHALSVNALALLVGTTIPASEQNTSLLSQPITADIGAGLSSELLTHRPDIRAAEQRLRSAQANIAAARAAFFPRISLTAGAGLASTELGDLFQTNSGTWIFSPQLVLPIFDAGRNKANLSLAEVRTDIAIASYEKTIQVAFREVADALSARATLAEEIAAQETVRASQAARLELAQARYKNGIANYLDVLDAERELFSAEQQLLQTKLLKITNTVDLYRSLGGGLNEVSQQSQK
jgi:multidrug efflux system outer membrane protein